MTWSRFDDRATESVKVRRAGTAACMLWFAAVNWCNAHHTDGVIERDLLAEVWRPIGEAFDHEAAARACLEAGLFELTPDGDYRVHDFLDYNPSRADAKAAQKAAAERARRYRERKSGVPSTVATVTPFVTRDATRDAGCVTTPGDVTRERNESRHATRERDDGAENRPVRVTPPRTRPEPVPEPVSVAHARTHAHAREREQPDPDGERWARWLSLRDEHGLAFDAPVNRQHLETAWQATERKLAAKLLQAPQDAFERLCRAYLTWPDGTPLPGGKTAVRGDRPASWLASGVYQLAEHLAGTIKPSKSSPADEAARRRELAAQRDARTA